MTHDSHCDVHPTLCSNTTTLNFETKEAFDLALGYALISAMSKYDIVSQLHDLGCGKAVNYVDIIELLEFGEINPDVFASQFFNSRCLLIKKDAFNENKYLVYHEKKHNDSGEFFNLAIYGGG